MQFNNIFNIVIDDAVLADSTMMMTMRRRRRINNDCDCAVRIMSGMIRVNQPIVERCFGDCVSESFRHS